jgi:hypothetical protein
VRGGGVAESRDFVEPRRGKEAAGSLPVEGDVGGRVIVADEVVVEGRMMVVAAVVGDAKGEGRADGMQAACAYEELSWQAAGVLEACDGRALSIGQSRESAAGSCLEEAAARDEARRAMGYGEDWAGRSDGRTGEGEYSAV